MADKKPVKEKRVPALTPRRPENNAQENKS